MSGGDSHEDRPDRHDSARHPARARRTAAGLGRAGVGGSQHPPGAGRDRGRRHRLGRGVQLQLHAGRPGDGRLDGGTGADWPGCDQHHRPEPRAATGAAPLRPLRNHHLRHLRNRHRAVGPRREAGRRCVGTTSWRTGVAATRPGLREPSQVRRLRTRRRHGACGARRGLPGHQAPRDGRTRGGGGARGDGGRRAAVRRHELPVDAGAGEGHGQSAQGPWSALAGRADISAGGLRGARAPPARVRSRPRVR